MPTQPSKQQATATTSDHWLSRALRAASRASLAAQRGNRCQAVTVAGLRYPVGVRLALLVLLASCAHSAPPSPAAIEPGHALGMNDVSILLPLPRDPQAPVLASAAELVDRAWFDTLVTEHHDIAPRNGATVAFEDFHVVAIRFDLCDRTATGACPTRVPGRLRLVLQPMYTVAGATLAHDIALHAFYAIPADQLATTVDELRALAALQHAPPTARLDVSLAAGDPVYLAHLRALVLRHARVDNLDRLTVIGQHADSAAFSWVFRGLERTGLPVAIPGVAANEQSLMVSGGDTIYRIDDLIDEPAGFALATNGAQFAAASPDQRAASLEALTAIQNPALHDTTNTQCIACHVATFLTARRVATSGLDPAAIAGRFQSSRDLTVHSIAATDARVVRGFGWAASFPAISQRVANDTAQVLAEIDARFPPRQP
jgi:hypothetical protein